MAIAIWDAHAGAALLAPTVHDSENLKPVLSGNAARKAATGTNALAAARFVDGD